MGVNYTPDFVSYTGQGAFKYWCQTVLPLVYDDSLSYYELLNKVVQYLNNVISDVSATETNVESLRTAYNQLQQYVNDYFDNLDVQNEIDEKLDTMASDGSLAEIVNPIISASTASWLADHITPTSPALDSSFTVANAAAESKTVGDKTLWYKGSLSDGTDANTIIDRGMYFIPFENTIVNSPATGRANLVVYAANGGWGVVQIWYDTLRGKNYFRTRTSEPIGWGNWQQIATLDDFSMSLNFKGQLPADSDLNSVTDRGIYFLDQNVNYLNKPTTSIGRAEMIVLTSESGNYGIVQLHFNTLNNQWHIRVKNSPSSEWMPWLRVGEYYMPSASRTIYMDNIGFNNTNGLYGATVTGVLATVGTAKRYNIKGANSITIKWYPKSQKDVSGTMTYCDILYVYFFDANGTKIGMNNQYDIGTLSEDGSKEFTVTPPSGTVTIACRVYNNGGPTDNLPNDYLTITALGITEIVEEKMPSLAPLSSSTRWCRFNYPVGKYVDDGGVVRAINNTGMIMFPPNYNANGKPSPVIVMVHGSSGYTSITGTEETDYENYYRYLADCGYVLIDCFGWTTRYASMTTTSIYNPWIIPTTCLAYMKVIQFALENFNLDKNNMFMYCKSLGGHLCAWLANKFDFKAVAMLAPAINLNYGYASRIYRQIMVADLGLRGTVNTEVGWATEEDCLNDFIDNYRSWTYVKRVPFCLANEDNIMGWCGEFINLSGDTAQNIITSSARHEFNRVDLARTAYPPTKFWFANDDEAIDPQVCRTFAQQLRNGGCYGAVRVMPNGTGGHHSVDSSSLALQKTGVTTPLGVSYSSVPLAYYEMWEYFEQHRT